MGKARDFLQELIRHRPGVVLEDLAHRFVVESFLTMIRQKAETVMSEALRLKPCDGKIAAQKAQVDQKIAELERQTQKSKQKTG